FSPHFLHIRCLLQRFLLRSLLSLVPIDFFSHSEIVCFCALLHSFAATHSGDGIPAHSIEALLLFLVAADEQKAAPMELLRRVCGFRCPKIEWSLRFIRSHLFLSC
uniref:Secreted protein n=1 Tax=Parascaris univalens TaxID=6257 RepID=A0A914ZI96_PARUN